MQWPRLRRGSRQSVACAHGTVQGARAGQPGDKWHAGVLWIVSSGDNRGLGAWINLRHSPASASANGNAFHFRRADCGRA